MRVLDLFSGIGGFALGFQMAGIADSPVAFCEIDPFCRAILKKHWPETICFEDIKNVTSDTLGTLGRIDLICGGFPCQPWSVAGKRKGVDDERHLWPEMLRIIGSVRPSWIVAENVPGIKTLGADLVLSDLEAEGYSCGSFVVGAWAVGAPHRRDRVWIIGKRIGNTQVQSLADSMCERPERGEVGGKGLGDAEVWRWNAESPQEKGSSWTTGRSNCMGDTDSKHSDRRDSVRHSWEEGSAFRHRWPSGKGSFQYEWEAPRTTTIIPPMGGSVDGLSRRLVQFGSRNALKSLGNAVVPQVVEMIGRAILSIENED